MATGAITVGVNTPPTATRLVFTVEPPSSIAAGAGFTVTVVAEDASGNVVSNNAAATTLLIANNPGGATFGNGLRLFTTNTATGSVTFTTNLSLNQPGIGYMLQATQGTLAAAFSSTFNVTAAAANRLVVTTPPVGSVPSGVPFGLVVMAEDSNGNVDPNYSGNVTVTLPANNPGGPGTTLGGTRTVQAVNGVATFSNLTLNNAAAGYSLNVTSSPSLTATTSGSFSITPAAASQLVVATQPNAVVPPGGSFGFTVLVEDASGNVVPSFSGPVTAALVANPGSDTLGGTIMVNAVNGVATFTNLILNNQATGYTLQATSDGLSPALTSAFNVAVNPPTHLIFTSPPASGLQVGSTFGVQVTVADALNNAVPNYNGPVTLTLGSGPAGATLTTVAGTPVVTSGGSGYLTNPTVTINGSGTGAPGNGHGHERGRHGNQPHQCRHRLLGTRLGLALAARSFPQPPSSCRRLAASCRQRPTSPTAAPGIPSRRWLH